MATVSASIIVQAPIEDVFAFVTDARNNVLWQANAGLQSTQQTPDDAVGVGTRITEVWRFMGRNAESVGEVVNFEPNRTYTRHLIAGTSPIKEGTATFEQDSSGTRWTSSFQIHAGGLFAMAEPLLANTLKKGMESSMATAKEVIERRNVSSAR
jgi:uncharacterized protein YndB with AHSA1/START domain